LYFKWYTKDWIKGIRNWNTYWKRTLSREAVTVQIALHFTTGTISNFRGGNVSARKTMPWLFKHKDSYSHLRKMTKCRDATTDAHSYASSTISFD
jgi:hypothetical protein